jgi:hypothetical protein
VAISWLRRILMVFLFVTTIGLFDTLRTRAAARERGNPHAFDGLAGNGTVGASQFPAPKIGKMDDVRSTPIAPGLAPCQIWS